MEIIVFTSPGCSACKKQFEILRNHFPSKKINVINVDKYPGKYSYIEATPTWAFRVAKNKYKLHAGVLNENQIKQLHSRGSSFGKTLLPGINDLAYYGDNFPNNKGFQIPQSFYGSIDSKWGTDPLGAGIGGYRSLGPGNGSNMFDTGYLNEIGMAHPADQLGTALALNRTCNTTSSTYSSPGIVAGTNSPQIVSNTTGFGRRTTGFGRRTTGFGKLYNQMGPAFEMGNQYLVNQNTGNLLYSGARQNEMSAPGSVQSMGYSNYISQAPPYKISQILPFGKKTVKKASKKTAKKASKKAVKTVMGKKNVNIQISVKRKSGVGSVNVGEGSVLRLTKMGRIKVKN
jgi:hypothetical protein